MWIALRQFSDSQPWQSTMTKGKLLEAKIMIWIMKLWFHHDSNMQVSGSHRGSSHLCIVMMLQLIPNSGITPIIGCLLKGLLNPKTSFYKSSAVAKKVNGGKKEASLEGICYIICFTRSTIGLLATSTTKKNVNNPCAAACCPHQNGKYKKCSLKVTAGDKVC